MGGSPCTSWSCAKSSGRETQPEGQGWELFKNYLIAKEKFQPDYFLYENNWSASKAIKAQIQEELNCELMRINSNLVSAQNRDRFYVFNWKIGQPEDRHIVLKDILETGENLESQDKAHCLTANYFKAVPWNTIEKKQRSMVADAVGVAYRSRPDETGKNVKRYEARGDRNANALTTVRTDSMVATPVGVGATTNNLKLYEVANGKIEIKGKQYPIKLKDGHYIIRKLTPIECERLQTMPDNYTAAVSNTQRYRGLGNGWTAEVIIHILQEALEGVSKNEKITVLSLYDGIGTGRYCLDKMGFTNVEYHAYEIDKYAIKVATSNYPDIIQHGDAFQVRDEIWVPPGIIRTEECFDRGGCFKFSS